MPEAKPLAEWGRQELEAEIMRLRKREASRGPEIAEARRQAWEEAVDILDGAMERVDDGKTWAAIIDGMRRRAAEGLP